MKTTPKHYKIYPDDRPMKYVVDIYNPNNETRLIERKYIQLSELSETIREFEQLGYAVDSITLE